MCYLMVQTSFDPELGFRDRFMLAFYTRALVDIKWDSYQLQEELARVRCPWA